MADLIAGDVVVVPFPFSNLVRAKRRPALVLAVLPDGDYILCQITSRPWPHAIPIDEQAFQTGSLPHASFIRPDKLFTGNEALILYRVGHLAPGVVRRVHERLLTIFAALAHDRSS